MNGKKEGGAMNMFKAYVQEINSTLRKSIHSAASSMVSFWGDLYKLSYFVGATVLSYFVRIQTACAKVLRKYWKLFYPEVCFCMRKVRYALSWIKHDIKLFFRKFSKGAKLLYRNTKAASKQGASHAVRAFFATIFSGMQRNINVIKRFANVALPAGAIVILGFVVGHFLTAGYALEVVVNGTNIGYITDESVYTQADSAMQQRIVYDQGDSVIKADVVFKVASVSNTQLSDVNKICDSLIQVSGAEIEQATGLYIDGKLYGATTDGQKLKDMLQGLKDSRKTGDPNEVVAFVRDVQTVDGLYATGKILTYDDLLGKVQQNEQQQLTYTVVQGDTPIGIAMKNGIAYSDLVNLNPGITEKIMPGQQLVVQTSQSPLRVQVVKTIQYTEVIPFATVTTRDSNYDLGTTVVATKGVNGQSLVTAQITYIDGIEVQRNIESRVTTQEPVTQKVLQGSKLFGRVYSVVGSGRYVWPVQGGGHISCYFRGYVGHTGLDIAAPSGTPILAVDDGVVVTASVLAANGRYLVIDHGNGIRTLYAHCSALLVSPGQTVKKGQIIALVGRTGRATGNHLHIEFHVNGVIVDPLRYLS